MKIHDCKLVVEAESFAEGKYHAQASELVAAYLGASELLSVAEHDLRNFIHNRKVAALRAAHLQL